MLVIRSAVIIFVTFFHVASFLDNNCLNQTCGDLTVRYPFKLTSTPACPSFSSFFELECKPSGKLYFNYATHIDVLTPLQVIEIIHSNNSLILDITSLRAASNESCGFQHFSTVSLPSFPGPYYISDDNKFVSLGCISGTLYTGILKDYSPQDYSQLEYSDYSDLEVGGCYVLYPADINNPECANHTCCVSSLPRRVLPRYAYYEVQEYTYDGSTLHANRSLCSNYSTCSSNFATLFYPDSTDFNNGFYRLKLKWALPSNRTANRIIQSTDYACSHGANLTIVDAVPGYVCSCNPGYTGDGYSNGSGCSDIDECKDPPTNNCILRSTTCHNLEGSYTCKCNSPFYVGDGLTKGSGCRFSPLLRNAFAISAA